jgi:predicted component of type VI protein secretion system
MTGYVLEIVEGPEAGRRLPLSGAVEIGRDPAADVPLLQDELVSRRHVRLTPRDDGVAVEDLDSRNGTFVDGDQIFGPAELAPGSQLLVGVTVLELQTAATVAGGRTRVQPIPASLTALRPLPAADLPASVTSERRVPTLAVPESEPDYVPASALEGRGAGRASALLPLLDVHTKGKARGAPIGIFVLVALAVILYLALR